MIFMHPFISKRPSGSGRLVQIISQYTGPGQIADIGLFIIVGNGQEILLSSECKNFFLLGREYSKIEDGNSVLPPVKRLGEKGGF